MWLNTDLKKDVMGQREKVSQATTPKYAVYFNTWNPHVTIHGIDCHYVRDREDPQSHGPSGEWNDFTDEGAARKFARKMSEGKGISLKDCWFCRKRGRLGL